MPVPHPGDHMPRLATASIAALLLFGSAVPLVGQAACTAKGKERWTVKTAAPTTSSVHAIRIANFATLDAPPSAISGTKGAKLSETRYTDSVNGLHEGQLVSVTAWVRLIKTSRDDCDYHIQIEPTQTGHDGMVIVEIPAADASHVTDSGLRGTLETVRATMLKDLKLTKEPSESGNKIGAAYMTITGALFFDGPHYPGCGSRGSGDSAVTCWEIHPVTAVRFAPRP